MEFSQAFVAGVDALGATLLHFLWQGALLGLGYFLIRPFCGSVAARYRLGMGTLLTLAICPLATLAYVWPQATSSATQAGVSPVVSGVIAAVADHPAAGWDAHTLLPALVVLWICGVVAIASRSLWHWRRLARLVRHAAAPLPEWETRLAQMCRRFGVLRPVRLLASASVVTPMLIGWLRPAILLPLSMLSGFSTHQIELIIAHELGHVRRWDYLANLVQVLIETVLFYHPVVHWISRDVRNARESCCDDLVLNLAQGNRIAYARALANLEELRHDHGPVAPALGAGGGVLLARIRRIVGVEGYDPMPRNNAWPILLLAAVLAGLALRPQTSAPDLAAALSNIPVESLAILSGNPRLVIAFDPPRLAAPVLDAQDLAVPDTSDTAAAPVRIERPHIESLALAGSKPISDLIAPRAAPVPPLASADAAAAVSAPTRLRTVAPLYPPKAMSAGVQGNVELSYAIGADGSVQDVRVVRQQPEGMFEDAARDALVQWLFAPPTDTTARYTQNFAFSLHAKSAAQEGAGSCHMVLGSMICRHLED